MSAEISNQGLFFCTQPDKGRGGAKQSSWQSTTVEEHRHVDFEECQDTSTSYGCASQREKGEWGERNTFVPKCSYAPFCASEVLDQLLRGDNSIVYNFYLKNGSGSVYIGSVFLI